MAGVDDATTDAAAADRTADADEDAHNPDLDRGPTRIVAKLHTRIGTGAETGNAAIADAAVAMTTVPLAEKPASADDAKRAVPAAETAAAAEAACEVMQSGTSEPWQQATVGCYATTALGRRIAVQ